MFLPELDEIDFEVTAPITPHEQMRSFDKRALSYNPERTAGIGRLGRKKLK